MSMIGNTRKVTVLLRGGLGNQLFGWAAGHSLARRLKLPLVVNGDQIRRKDTWILDPRVYELGFLGLAEARNRFWPAWRKSSPPVFRESRDGYDGRVAKLTAPVVLDGYFQSWRYFDAHQTEIISIVREGIKNITESQALVSELQGSSWIGVHVRRGDFLKVTGVALPGLDYYSRAVDIVGEKVNADRVVVFTDDVANAEGVVPQATRYVGPAELPNAKAVLACLSQSDGIVGANSTLSWWSRFVHFNENVASVFPAEWTTNSPVPPKDLLPPEWQTLAVSPRP